MVLQLGFKNGNEEAARMRNEAGYLVKLVGSPYSEDRAEPTFSNELPEYLEFERWLDGPDNDYDNEYEDDGTPLPEGERVIRFRLTPGKPIPDIRGRPVWTYEYVERTSTVT